MCCFSYACVSRLINIHNNLTIVENVDVVVKNCFRSRECWNTYFGKRFTLLSTKNNIRDQMNYLFTVITLKCIFKTFFIKTLDRWRRQIQFSHNANLRLWRQRVSGLQGISDGHRHRNLPNGRKQIGLGIQTLRFGKHLIDFKWM